MQKYVIKSSFKSLPIEIFYYPSLAKSNKTVFLMKGIYGLHKPSDDTSWDQEIIFRGKDQYNFLVINTSRFGKTDQERSSKEAFIGKTFQQECADFKKAFKFIKDNQILDTQGLSIIANSFGGTTLLALPSILNLAQTVTMIGSGCGKSPTTTKPLLETLLEEEKLLQGIRKFKGGFGFVHGANDTVVPEESQNKIVQNALKVSVAVVYKVMNANHDLSIDDVKIKFNRADFILNIVDYLNSIS